jgi:cell division protease FtsH
VLAAFILGITYDDIERWAITWLPILFLGLLVFLVWRTLKLMPRTKPQQITPSSASWVTWDDIAGVEETKD